MAGEVKGKFKKYDLATTAWIVYWFASVTSQIASDSATRRYVTDTQLGLIDAFVGTPSDGQIWLYNQMTSQWEPSSDFLRKGSPSFTGVMVGGEIRSLEGIPDTKIKILAKDDNAVPSVTSSFIELLRNGQINMFASTGQISINPGTVLNINGKRITTLGAPTASTDAATKEYVDNLVALSVRPVSAVKCASVANIASLSGLVAIDGYTLLNGNRILVKNQTTVLQNGIYTAATGAWTKVTADSGVGAFVFVENGSTQNDWMYYCQAANTWIEHSKFDTYNVIAGGGLQKNSSNNFGIAALGVTNDMLAGEVSLAKLANVAVTSIDVEAWTGIGSNDASQNLAVWMNQMFGAIKLLRGTGTHNTNNAQTILGAYKKNKVYVGTTAPTGTTEVPIADGDVWIDTTT